MFTKREHVKILAKNVVMRLEQDESIVLNPRMRQNIYQDLYLKLEPLILTDEEIKEKVVHELGAKAESLGETGSTESDQFKAAKTVLMNKVGENAVMGLYYQRPIKDVAQIVGNFLMNHHLVEDVYPSDEELEKTIVDFCKKFNPENLH